VPDLGLLAVAKCQNLMVAGRGPTTTYRNNPSASSSLRGKNLMTRHSITTCTFLQFRVSSSPFHALLLHGTSLIICSCPLPRAVVNHCMSECQIVLSDIAHTVPTVTPILTHSRPQRSRSVFSAERAHRLNMSSTTHRLLPACPIDHHLGLWTAYRIQQVAMLCRRQYPALSLSPEQRR